MAEIYGPTDAARTKLATEVKKIFAETSGVVDVDWFREADRQRRVLRVDKEKAALNGISEKQITRAIEIAVQGYALDLYHLQHDKESVEIVLELPPEYRARVESLLNISLRSDTNPSA
ncbi:MAG: efflux RND transporter permease subunit, partial [Thermoanaerobaculia bacterium]